MRKKIVILNDRSSLTDRLINIGDRAMTDGFYELVKRNCDCDIISGGWKNFPYFNMRNFEPCASILEINKAFEGLMFKLLNENRTKIRNERIILELIDNNLIFNNFITQYIDLMFSKKFSRGLFETIKPFLLRTPFSESLLNKIQSADLVINNGGPLISDNLEFYIPSHLFECFFAKKIGKPVISMNQTVYVRKPLNRKMASWVYGMLDFHMTREPFSTDELIDMGIGKEKIITSCDAAFAADYHMDANMVENTVLKYDLAKGGIGIAIRGDRKVDYEYLASLIKFMANKYNKRVYYISTCKSHDMHVFKKLSKLCEISFFDDLNNYRLVAQIMKSLDLIITDRYHTAIFAIVANTPVLPFKPQSIKMEGLFKLFSYPFKVLSFEEKYMKETVENIDYIFNNQNKIKNILGNAYTKLRRKVHNDMKDICITFLGQDLGH